MRCFPLRVEEGFAACRNHPRVISLRSGKRSFCWQARTRVSFWIYDHRPECRLRKTLGISTAEEKTAFEWFVDIVMERWRLHPSMHIYHFSHKEPSTLKALMGRYATREGENRWLTAKPFVDLHSILKQSVRASVEQYSLKDLEKFHGFTRGLPLDQARAAMRQIEHALELGNADEIADATRRLVETYNSDDCRSTESLRDWLEGIRKAESERGANIPRPVEQDGAAPENV